MRYQLDLRRMEDLPISSLGRRVRTRLYFTSESHLHTILNVLRWVRACVRACVFAVSKIIRLCARVVCVRVYGLCPTACDWLRVFCPISLFYLFFVSNGEVVVVVPGFPL